MLYLYYILGVSMNPFALECQGEKSILWEKQLRNPEVLQYPSC